MRVRAGGSGRRIAAAIEMGLALVGVPAALLASAGLPAWPDWPSLEEMRQVLTGPSELLPDALIPPAIWVVWGLWLYLAVAVALSAAAHLGGRLGLRGADRLFGLRGRLVPAVLCGVIDALFVASLAVGPKSQASAWVADAVAVAGVPARPDPAPLAAPSGAAEPDREPGAHVVERGETLSGIAAEECGSAERWPQVFEANLGREVARVRT